MDTAYRVGAPSPGTVWAHEQRFGIVDPVGRELGGLWQAIDPGSHVLPDVATSVRLSVDGLPGISVAEGRAVLSNGVSVWQALGECRWAERSRYRPVDREGNPVAWPTDEEAASAGLSPAPQRVNREDERIGASMRRPY
jgi:hypothetical protein